jgi:shikimate kinase
VVIIGFMGTGKTTVGRLLAERLGRRFVDLDDAVSGAAGQAIADIFRSGGEAAFRELEEQALRRVLAEPDIVLAAGGGAACREPNLTLMLASGPVVALFAPAEEVLRRTGVGSGRPLLDTAADPLQAARELLRQRESFYARAPIRVDTVGKQPEDVVNEVLASLTKQRESS